MAEIRIFTEQMETFNHFFERGMLVMIEKESGLYMQGPITKLWYHVIVEDST